MSCVNVFEKYDVVRESNYFKAKRDDSCAICERRIRKGDVICKVRLTEKKAIVLDGIPVRFGHYGYAHKKCAEGLRTARKPCPRCGSLNVDEIIGDSDYNKFCKSCGFAWWDE